MRTALAMTVGVLVLAGCGPDPATRADDAPRTTPAAATAPAARPTAVPPAAGPVTTTYAVTVLDDGDGAELCLGGVATSLPPQCGGPRLVGWDWADHAGHFEQRAGVRWGAFAVTGRFDGSTLTPTEVVPAARHDAPPYPEDRDLATPCPEPEGGWRVLDPARTTPAAMHRTFAAARRLPGYTDAWMDQSPNDADPESEPERMNDPTKLVVNVRVTGDPGPAEARLREIWGGALCVTGGMPRSHRELRRLQREAHELPGALSSHPDGEAVALTVVHDDGSLQAWLDRRHGPGAVRVTSALTPMD